MRAVLDKHADGFDRVFGPRRGHRGRVEAPNDVLAAYLDLTDEDLDLCIVLAEGSEGAVEVMRVLRSAKIERDSLELLSDDWLMRLRARRSAPSLTDDPLMAKLQACFDARCDRYEVELAAQGGRPMEMFSIEGNIAVTQLVDSLVGLSADDAEQALAEGVAQIARCHSEIHDTAVSESIGAELDRLDIKLSS